MTADSRVELLTLAGWLLPDTFAHLHDARPMKESEISIHWLCTTNLKKETARNVQPAIYRSL